MQSKPDQYKMELIRRDVFFRKYRVYLEDNKGQFDHKMMRRFIRRDRICNIFVFFAIKNNPDITEEELLRLFNAQFSLTYYDILLDHDT